MTDRVPTKVLGNGAVRYGVYDEDGNLLRYEYIKAEDDPSEIGTPLRKETLLKDATAQAIGLTQEDPTVDDALDKLGKTISNSNGFPRWAMCELPESWNWRDIEYGNSGRLVVVGNRCKIYTKGHNNTNWTKAETPIDDTYSGSIAYGNGMFVVVIGNSDKSLYSRNGSEWSVTSIHYGESTQRSVAYGNNKFVSVCYGSAKVAYSENGIDWETTYMPNARDWWSLDFAGGKFFAVGNGNIYAYSNDGISWEESTIPTDGTHDGVAYGNGKYVLAGNAGILYSFDSINWEKAFVASNFSGISGPVTFGNGTFIVVPRVGRGAIALYSKDGINWKETALPYYNDWCGVKYVEGRFWSIAEYDSNKVIMTLTTD